HRLGIAMCGPMNFWLPRWPRSAGNAPAAQLPYSCAQLIDGANRPDIRQSGRFRFLILQNAIGKIKPVPR
ncbi:MAG TPA: hypothetical protein VGH08_05955, partial [Chthoniobacterales bacterium]